MKRNQRNKIKGAQDESHTTPHEQRSDKETTNRHVYVEPGVQIDLVQDLKKTYENAQGDATTHNKKQLLWTKIAAGLLFITAGLAGWQGYSAKKTADSSVIDRRPYLVVKLPGNVTPKLAADVPLLASVTIANIGRTPAIDNYQIVKLVYFHQPKPTDYRPDQYVVEAEKQFADSESAKLNAEERQARSILRPLGAEQDVAPNADYLSGEIKGLTLTQEQFDDITSVSRGNRWAGAVFEIGLITYTDSTHQPYYTEFCWFALDPAALDWERCRWHNIIR